MTVTATLLWPEAGEQDFLGLLAIWTLGYWIATGGVKSVRSRLSIPILLPIFHNTTQRLLHVHQLGLQGIMSLRVPWSAKANVCTENCARMLALSLGAMSGHG